jgi:hypothetical protein
VIHEVASLNLLDQRIVLAIEMVELLKVKTTTNRGSFGPLLYRRMRLALTALLHGDDY